MYPVYLKKQQKIVDQLAAQLLDLSADELMHKAATAVYSYVQHRNNILVVTGTGHNAGDGFIIALLALKSGKNVQLWPLTDINQLPINARKAANDYLAAGGQCIDQPQQKNYDCIIDAIFGTGLNRVVTGHYAQAIKWINQQNITTVAVDIPSGLDADTGAIQGIAISAQITIAIICYKPGLFTNHGKDRVGELFLADLDVPEDLFSQASTAIKLLGDEIFKHPLLHHQHNSHKGAFGHVLVVGGKTAMLGAAILTARAALRSGCGLVESVCLSQHSVSMALQCPELMTCNSLNDSRLINSAQVIAIGPGLGLDSVAKKTFADCLEQNTSMVIDADALTLMAQHYQFDNTSVLPIKFSDQVVLTPHPKEAARLLNCDTQTIQNDRIAAALALSKRYRAQVVLKGSGTIICGTTGEVFICPRGYSGMATAGMGDVLTGIIAGLMAQGLAALEAAKIAVYWHALAAENCQKGNSLIASDVIEQLTSIFKS